MNKKIIAFLVSILCTSSFVIAEPLNPKRPTEYIMQFLPASTTLWLNSDSWKDSIRRYEIIRTKYNQSAIDVKYEICLDHEKINLSTNIDEIHEITAKDIKEFNEILLTDNNRETIYDYSSECHVTTRIKSYDEESKSIKFTKAIKCTSYIIEKAASIKK
jgi:hypothetical protein